MYRVNLIDIFTEELVRTSEEAFRTYEAAEIWGKEQSNQWPNELSYEVVNEDGSEI